MSASARNCLQCINFENQIKKIVYDFKSKIDTLTLDNNILKCQIEKSFTCSDQSQNYQNEVNVLKKNIDLLLISNESHVREIQELKVSMNKRENICAMCCKPLMELEKKVFESSQVDVNCIENGMDANVHSHMEAVFKKYIKLEADLNRERLWQQSMKETYELNMEEMKALKDENEDLRKQVVNLTAKIKGNKSSIKSIDLESSVISNVEINTEAIYRSPKSNDETSKEVLVTDLISKCRKLLDEIPNLPNEKYFYVNNIPNELESSFQDNKKTKIIQKEQKVVGKTLIKNKKLKVNSKIKDIDSVSSNVNDSVKSKNNDALNFQCDSSDFSLLSHVSDSDVSENITLKSKTLIKNKKLKVNSKIKETDSVFSNVNDSVKSKNNGALNFQCNSSDFSLLSHVSDSDVSENITLKSKNISHGCISKNESNDCISLTVESGLNQNCNNKKKKINDISVSKEGENLKEHSLHENFIQKEDTARLSDTSESEDDNDDNYKLQADVELDFSICEFDFESEVMKSIECDQGEPQKHVNIDKFDINNKINNKEFDIERSDDIDFIENSQSKDEDNASYKNTECLDHVEENQSDNIESKYLDFSFNDFNKQSNVVEEMSKQDETFNKEFTFVKEDNTKVIGVLVENVVNNEDEINNTCEKHKVAETITEVLKITNIINDERTSKTQNVSNGTLINDEGRSNVDMDESFIDFDYLNGNSSNCYEQPIVLLNDKSSSLNISSPDLDVPSLKNTHSEYIQVYDVNQSDEICKETISLEKDKCTSNQVKSLLFGDSSESSDDDKNDTTEDKRNGVSSFTKCDKQQTTRLDKDSEKELNKIIYKEKPVRTFHEDISDLSSLSDCTILEEREVKNVRKRKRKLNTKKSNEDTAIQIKKMRRECGLSSNSSISSNDEREEVTENFSKEMSVPNNMVRVSNDLGLLSNDLICLNVEDISQNKNVDSVQLVTNKSNEVVKSKENDLLSDSLNFSNISDEMTQYMAKNKNIEIENLQSKMLEDVSKGNDCDLLSSSSDSSSSVDETIEDILKYNNKDTDKVQSWTLDTSENVRQPNDCDSLDFSTIEIDEIEDIAKFAKVPAVLSVPQNIVKVHKLHLSNNHNEKTGDKEKNNNVKTVQTKIKRVEDVINLNTCEVLSSNLDFSNIDNTEIEDIATHKMMEKEQKLSKETGLKVLNDICLDDSKPTTIRIDCHESNTDKERDNQKCKKRRGNNAEVLSDKFIKESVNVKGIFLNETENKKAKLDDGTVNILNKIDLDLGEICDTNDLDWSQVLVTDIGVDITVDFDLLESCIQPPTVSPRSVLTILEESHKLSKDSINTYKSFSAFFDSNEILSELRLSQYKMSETNLILKQNCHMKTLNFNKSLCSRKCVQVSLRLKSCLLKNKDGGREIVGFYSKLPKVEGNFHYFCIYFLQTITGPWMKLHVNAIDMKYLFDLSAFLFPTIMTKFCDKEHGLNIFALYIMEYLLQLEFQDQNDLRLLHFVIGVAFCVYQSLNEPERIIALIIDILQNTNVPTSFIVSTIDIGFMDYFDSVLTNFTHNWLLTFLRLLFQFEVGAAVSSPVIPNISDDGKSFWLGNISQFQDCHIYYFLRDFLVSNPQFCHLMNSLFLIVKKRCVK